MNKLRIALTKGRLQKSTVALLKKAGFDCSDVEDPGRRLLIPMDEGIEIVLAKAPDVITYVEHGVCDIGVVGKDTIMELGHSFYEVLDLGFGRCRFVLAAKADDNFDASRIKRVASKYPNVASSYFESRGIDADIIKIEGSVELAPLLGLADAIVDIVETGSTLKANGLAVVDEVAPVSARMIVNLASMKIKKREILDFLGKCERAMDA